MSSSRGLLVLVSLALLFGNGASLHAQPKPFPSGTLLRVTPQPTVPAVLGEFDRVASGRLLLRNVHKAGGILGDADFAITEVASVERHEVYGSLATKMAAGGFVIGAAVMAPCNRDNCSTIAARLLEGGAVGAVAGLIIGSRFKRSRWINVPLALLR